MKGLLAFIMGHAQAPQQGRACAKALFIHVGLAQFQRLEVGFLQFRGQEFFDGGF